MMAWSFRGAGLGLTWGNVAWVEGRPQVKQARPAALERHTQLRQTFPRKRGAASALLLRGPTAAAGAKPYVNMDPAET
jgi:hypothetical protein